MTVPVGAERGARTLAEGPRLARAPSEISDSASILAGFPATNEAERQT